MSRRLLLLGLAVLLVLAGAGIGAAAAAPRAAALTVSPVASIAGERVVIAGRLPVRVRRPVHLQRRSGARWVVVEHSSSTTTGRFAFRVVSASATYRVVAPATRHPRRAAWASAAASVRPVAQSVALAPPATAVAGLPATFTSTARPARPGRSVRLERRIGASWVALGAGTESSTGRTIFRITPPEAATWELRARVLASAGAAAVVSKVVGIEVDPAPEPEPVFPDATGPVARLTDTPAGTYPATTGYGAGAGNVMSANGRYLVFSTEVSTVVPGDDNDLTDSFLYDRQTGEVSVLGRDVDGGVPRGGTTSPTISADGRWIAFAGSDTLLRGDAGIGTPVVYLWDRRLDRLRIITSGRSHAPAISADGNHVAYLAVTVRWDRYEQQDAYVWSRATGRERLVSARADNGMGAGAVSGPPRISADGRFVLYRATGDRVLPDVPGRSWDERLIRWDRSSGTSRIVNLTLSGEVSQGWAEEPWLSGDGRWVLYTPTADDIAPGDGPGPNEELTRDALLWDAQTGATVIVNRDSADAAPTRPGAGAGLSSDGRYVFYRTPTSSLFPSAEETPPGQIVRWDRQTGTRTLVTRNADGVKADEGAGALGVAGDGRFILLSTPATNLADDDTNGRFDLHVADAEWTPEGGAGTGFAEPHTASPVAWARPDIAGPTRSAVLASARPDGVAVGGWEGSASVDGRYVVLSSTAAALDATLAEDPTAAGTGEEVFVRDMTTGTVDRVSDGLAGAGGNRSSSRASISATGRWVLYESLASDIVEGDLDRSGDHDLFLWDRVTGQTTWVTRPAPEYADESKNPMHGGALSPNGTWVAFWTDVSMEPGQTVDPTLRRLYVWNRMTGEYTRMVLPLGPHPVSTDAGLGAAGPVSVSNDGKVVFASHVTDIERTPGRDVVDVFLWNAVTNALTVVNRTPSGARTAEGASTRPRISADGKVVVYESHASDLVAGDVNDAPDIFVWNASTRATRLVSRPPSGGPADGGSLWPTVSADGSVVAFISHASNLAPGDSNRGPDGYVWRAASGTLQLAPSAAISPNDETETAAITGDGRRVVIGTLAWNWGVADTNHDDLHTEGRDVYVLDAMP